MSVVHLSGTAARIGSNRNLSRPFFAFLQLYIGGHSALWRRSDRESIVCNLHVRKSTLATLLRAVPRIRILRAMSLLRIARSDYGLPPPHPQVRHRTASPTDRTKARCTLSLLRLANIQSKELVIVRGQEKCMNPLSRAAAQKEFAELEDQQRMVNKQSPRRTVRF